MTQTASARRRNFAITAFLFATACCNLVVPLQVAKKLKSGYQDFVIYYGAGKMLREGRAAALYNLSAQYQTQLTFAAVPIRQGALPFNHPPFEALLFLPFTWLSFWPAYLLWTAVSLAMLTASLILLRRYSAIRGLHPVLIAASVLAFFPLITELLQGQDVILVLFAAVMALTFLERGKDVAAGAWLSMGLVRPHMVIPLLLLLAVRRWRMLLGFVPVGFVLIGITVAIMGWRGPIEYLRFVLFVERTGIGNFGPQTVPNLRGLLGSLLGHFSRPLLALSVAVSSVGVFVAAARRIHSGRDGLAHSFCLAIVTTILVSFHALPYDLTLLLPVVLFLLGAAMTDSESGPGRLLLLFVLFLSPVYIYLVFQVGQFFVYGLVMLCLYVRLLRMHAPAAEPA